MSKRIQTYATEQVTVTFDPNICVHSGVCLRTLPRVFNIKERRWIQLEHAPAKEVGAAVARCPSGALHIPSSPSTESRPLSPPPTASEDSTPPHTVQIELLTDGPVRVEGPVRIQTESGEVIEKAGRVHLCRCGASAKKPFCDGSHRECGFTSQSSGSAT